MRNHKYIVIYYFGFVTGWLGCYAMHPNILIAAGAGIVFGWIMMIWATNAFWNPEIDEIIEISQGEIVGCVDMFAHHVTIAMMLGMYWEMSKYRAALHHVAWRPDLLPREFLSAPLAMIIVMAVWHAAHVYITRKRKSSYP